MKDLSDHYQEVGQWLDGSGPDADIVISSRVRLARNVAGFTFFAHAGSDQRVEVYDFIRSRILTTHLNNNFWFLNLEDLSEMERSLLTERHLISTQLAQGAGARGVAVSHDEKLALMINEEDHLRIQALSSGLQLYETYKTISGIDDILEENIEYSFSPDYGYLTACPTNVGTGIRVSAMLHLPALKMSGQMDKVLRAARDLQLAVRGLYGEGSEPIGDFFQISNQITLGKSESQIIEELIGSAVQPIVAYERRARQKLLESHSPLLEDKIYRALGILTHSRIISSEESLYLLSYLRLGIYLGLVKHIELETTSKLFLFTQPAHLQTLCKKSLSTAERDEARANLIRRYLTETK
jgi:protein arginine kinase